MTNPKPPPLVGPHGLMPVLTDWWNELNWPRILGSARLGLRPGRLGLAFFAIIIAVLLLNLGLTVDARLVKGGVDWPSWPWSLKAEPREQLMHLWRAFITLPKRLVAGAPVTTLVIGPIVLTVWLTMLGAISRISAGDLSHSESLSWSQGLRFTIPRWRSLLGAVLGPLVIVWLITAALVLGGWVLMHLPGVNVAGGLLYGLFLIGGFLATIILIGYIMAHNLFIPAVVCEGTDAIDAVQRGYTYFFAKPIRLIWYSACGAAGLLLVMAAVVLLARWTIGFAAQGASVWAGPEGGRMVWSGTCEALSSVPRMLGNGYDTEHARPVAPQPTAVGHDPLKAPAGTWVPGASLIRFWTTIPVILVLAAFLSCFMSVATALYMGMRRVCDGQDWAELWMPGMIAGTMATSMAGRARVAQDLGAVQPSQPLPEADEE